MRKLYLHGEVSMAMDEKGETKFICKVCGKEIEAPLSEVPCVDPDHYIPVVDNVGFALIASKDGAGLVVLDVSDKLLGLKFRFMAFSADNNRELAQAIMEAARDYAINLVDGELPQQPRFFIPPLEFVKFIEKMYREGEIGFVPAEEETGQ